MCTEREWFGGRNLVRCNDFFLLFKTMANLYSYPYLNQQKPLFLPIIAYTLSTTKLEIKAK
jgi:hypothetical protein